MNKPLAKSLHTVTVLVRVAKIYLPSVGQASEESRNKVAVMAAIKALGLGDMPDTYGLVDAAIKQLNK
jgi:hypothetical protein